MAPSLDIYKSLDPASREIRLIELLPAGTLEDSLHCELTQARLDDHPPYEAVSYHWGGLELTHEISLNATVIKITKNLDEILRYLRDTSRSRMLWVDALCINQDDVKERSHQVTLMKEIYQSCVVDIVWIMPGSKYVSWEDLRDGFDLLEKIHAHDPKTLGCMQENTHCHNSLKRPGTDKNGEQKPRYTLSYAEKKCLQAVFSHAKVWKRVWVMQELSCAPKIQLRARTDSFDWALLSNFLGDKNYADAFHGPFGHGTMHPVIGSIFGRIKSIENQRRLVQDTTSGRQSKLMDVLARFRGTEASDVRDKIYGLLGLVSGPIDIKVDYSLSAGDVFAGVSAAIFNLDGNLDLLCQGPWHSNGENRLKDLPSWAADFTLSSGETMLFGQRSIYNAGESFCKTPCRVDKRGRLAASGYIVGTLQAMLERPSMLENDESESSENRKSYNWVYILHRRWMKAYFDNSLIASPSGATAVIYPPTGEPAFQAFVRTLLTDIKGYPISRLSGEDIEHELSAFRDSLRLDSNDHNEHYRILGNLHSYSIWAKNSRDWTFALLESGHYVLVLDACTREGDKIAILDGAKVPVVLRQVGHEAEAEFEYVNVAYVHGLMDGEAIELSKNGKLGREEFWLI
jgi:hypothetical protein